MAAVAGGGGSIRVTPEALQGLAQQLREHASRARSVLGEVSGKTQVHLNQAELQASLEAFNRMWGRAAFGAAGGVANAVDHAATSYQRTEDDLAALLQPGETPTDITMPIPGSPGRYAEGGANPATVASGGDVGEFLDIRSSGDTASAPSSPSDYIGGLASGSEQARQESGQEAGQAAPGPPASSDTEN